MSKKSDILRSPALHLFFISVVTIIIYSNTFSVPFHFDDKLNIVDNSLVKHLGNLWPPAGTRWFGFLTFALNYRLNGLKPPGYHAVNLGIHVLNSILIYWLVLLTFRTPYFRPGVTNVQLNRETVVSSTAFLASLLFAVHPVQTQAVTYIIQRLASLATFFYLLSLTAYILARLNSLSQVPVSGRDRRTRLPAEWSLYAVSALSALIAMKTKEIAFTLPFIMILYELSFLETTPFSIRGLIRKIFYFFPFFLMLLVIPMGITRFNTNLEHVFGSFIATNEISRHDYLMTQFRVLVTYIRLLFLPVHQSLDYDYPVYRSFFDPAVLFSFLFLSCLFGLGVVLFFRSRFSPRLIRLAAFGIFWFFITISVESSIVPIADVIFEHRLYLPSVGALIAITIAAISAARRVQNRVPRALTGAVSAGILIVIVLSTASFLRNTVWRSEISVWEDVAEKHPANVRAYNMLGILYRENGRPEKAVKAFSTAVRLKPAYAEGHVNLGSMYVEAGNLDEGMNEFMIALRLQNLDEIDTANLFVNIGYCYLKKGLPDRAIEFYNYAAGLVPDDANIYSFLAKAYAAKGMSDVAVSYLHKAHKLNPDRF